MLRLSSDAAGLETGEGGVAWGLVEFDFGLRCEVDCRVLGGGGRHLWSGHVRGRWFVIGESVLMWFI